MSICPVATRYRDELASRARWRKRPELAQIERAALPPDGGPRAQRARALWLADWACRWVAPAALAAVSPDHARRLAALDPVVDERTARAAADAAYASARWAAGDSVDAAARGAARGAAYAADAAADAACAAYAASYVTCAAADAADAAYADAATKAEIVRLAVAHLTDGGPLPRPAAAALEACLVGLDRQLDRTRYVIGVEELSRLAMGRTLTRRHAWELLRALPKGPARTLLRKATAWQLETQESRKRKRKSA